MKKYRGILAGMFLAAMVLVFGGARQAYAYSSGLTVTDIQPGQLVTGNTENGNGHEWDYYRLHLSFPGVLSMKIRSEKREIPDCSCWYVSICQDINGEIYDSFVVRNNGSWEKSEPIGLPAGDYYVQIVSYDRSNATTTSPYQFVTEYQSSDRWEQEPNDVLYQATDIRTNQEYRGVTGRMDQRDCFRFKLGAPGYVSVKLDTPNLYDNSTSWNVYLVDVNEEYYYDSYTVTGTDEHGETAKIGLPQGTYYVIVSSAYRQSSEPYRLNVEYHAARNWEQEDNDTPKKASGIWLREEIHGVTVQGRKSETDYYRFTDILPDGNYRFRLKKNASADGGVYEMTLYNSALEEVSRRIVYGNETSAVWEVPLKKDTYYLAVSSAEWDGAVSREEYVLSAEPYAEVGNVTGLRASGNKTSRLKLSWDAAAGAECYEIRQYDSASKKWKLVVQSDKTSCTVKGLGSGKTYKFSVRGLAHSGGETFLSPKETVVTTSTLPGMVAFKLRPGKNSIKVTWKKVKGASGYKVYYRSSPKGKMKLLKTVKAKTLSYTKKKLKKGNTYYFAVRAYRKVDGKEYLGSYLPRKAKAK